MSHVPENKGGEAPRRAATQQRQLGSVRHRALLLAMQNRHAEAAEVLLAHIDFSHADLPSLGNEERRLLSVAATYLQKAGETARAAAVFEALGEEERAALSRRATDLELQSAERLGASATQPAPPLPGASPSLGLAPSLGPTPSRGPSRPDPAASLDGAPFLGAPSPGPEPEPASRVVPAPLSASPPTIDLPTPGDRPPLSDDAMQRLRAVAHTLVDTGKPGEAGVMLAGAGLWYEAGVCFVKAGDLRQALANVIKTPAGSPQYRSAARTAVRLLAKTGHVSGVQLAFLRDFVHAGPADESEIELFLRLAELVEASSSASDARTVLEAARRVFPKHSELRARLNKLDDSIASHTLFAVDETGTNEAPIAVSGQVPQVPTGRPEMPVQPGVLVAERFRIKAEIGRGGMATVYSATDLELDEEIALKVFSGQLVTAPFINEAVQRFRQELKLCRKLRHANIIQVYDIGIHGGYRYFTMELLRGRSLDKLLGAPIEVPWGIECLIQASVGLHAAHQEGVVHRDVKPENIFVTDDGVIKLMDFGIAKSSYTPGQTTVGTLAGTPEYMAPEQISDFSGAGPTADQYSLGVVAYQIFTGQLPFVHKEMMRILIMHMEQTPAPLKTLRPDLPDALEAIVLRMLAKNPAERFESCWELARTLAALRD